MVAFRASGVAGFRCFALSGSNFEISGQRSLNFEAAGVAGVDGKRVPAGLGWVFMGSPATPPYINPAWFPLNELNRGGDHKSCTGAGS